MNRRSFHQRLLMALLPSALLPAFSHAQEAAWPQKPVRIVVPFAAGGSSDALGRLVANGLTEIFKQSFVIENRGGAGGVLGSQIVSKSAPDGYTLVISGVASHVIAPLENPKVFDPVKDFTHIAILGGPPIALAVNASVSATDVKSFIEMAKRTPQGISWGSPGQGTHGYLIGEAFEVLTKTPMQHIAYKGAAPAVADLVAGHIPASFTTLSTAATQVKSGKVRLLAASSAKRLPAFPDVPTFTELGYPTLTGVTWFSLSGPAGMPPELVARINAAVRKVMSSPQAQEQLIKTSMETYDFDVPRFNQFILAEIKQWTPMVKQVKID